MGVFFPPLRVREVDGDPSKRPIYELVFTNSTVAIEGNTATVDISGEVTPQTYFYDNLTNETGSTLLNGRVVKLATSNKIEYATNITEETSEAIGLLIEDIAHGNQGKVVLTGILPVGSVSGFNPGDDIYLDSSNGQVTAIPPSSGVIVYIGKYNNGKVYLNIHHIVTLS